MPTSWWWREEKAGGFAQTLKKGSSRSTQTSQSHLSSSWTEGGMYKSQAKTSPRPVAKSRTYNLKLAFILNEMAITFPHPCAIIWHLSTCTINKQRIPAARRFQIQAIIQPERIISHQVHQAFTFNALGVFAHVYHAQAIWDWPRTDRSDLKRFR